MAGNLYGADIEALRQLADGIARGGEALGGVVQMVEAAMPAPEQWSGPDSEQFREEWNHVHAAALRETAAALNDVAATVRENADDQEGTSENLDGAAAAAPLGGGAAAFAGAAATGAAGVAGPAGADERLHRELLEEYQVAPDDTTMWPAGAGGWLVDQAGRLNDLTGERLPVPNREEVTEAEAQMLDDLLRRQGPGAVMDVMDLRQDALHVAESRYDEGLTDGHGDAFRHAYWNALMTQRFGEEWVSEFATAHERGPTSHPVPVAMDLHNNEIGREIALRNPDAGPEELADIVQQAVTDGDMVVIDENDMLWRSDELDPSEARKTREEDLAWPVVTTERNGHHDPGDPSARPEY
ncbi:DUF6973 domain-containing protein [Myceligenerans salitolerans]|uniref:DUF6973 domain-containing protein n=1 Tax=Myceligenerans salitolerans TaxID=1230528 RepID=A0ABS3I9J6_9MICO|nr:hypothetical protein [Myceligenerans salitolerans]MBO0608732.1 hypothetical protein [Myceligenerans salitolerans]